MGKELASNIFRHIRIKRAMGKKPPPPKPEELIEKLDEKVNHHF